MNDLQPGRYIIVLAAQSAPPPFPVGANLQGGPVAPVITGGRDHIWLVTRNANGTYTLTLIEGGMKYLSKPDKDGVVVESMPGPHPGEWVIREQKDNTHSIEVPSPIIPNRAWTLRHTRPESKVELGIFELPMPDQLWRFIRLPEE